MRSATEQSAKASAEVRRQFSATVDVAHHLLKASAVSYTHLFNLQATAEAYPQLQANQNFMDLQNQLKELENKIAYARQIYNDVVLKLNTAIETVPTNIIAGLFHFEQAQYFEADDASRQVPQVQF